MIRVDDHEVKVRIPGTKREGGNRQVSCEVCQNGRERMEDERWLGVIDSRGEILQRLKVHAELHCFGNR